MTVEKGSTKLSVLTLEVIMPHVFKSLLNTTVGETLPSGEDFSVARKTVHYNIINGGREYLCVVDCAEEIVASLYDVTRHANMQRIQRKTYDISGISKTYNGNGGDHIRKENLIAEEIMDKGLDF